MNDLHGRAYATVATTKTGDIVEADGDFTCIAKGQKLTVQSDDHGLFIPCSEGHHCLDGQIRTDDGATEAYYIGLYPIS